jgi:uncharacterized protein (DUF2235 family)
MADWVLIFSDGTGQRGVPDGKGASRNSNVYRLHMRAKQQGLNPFYDQGIGVPEEGEPEWLTWAYNLVAKATGLGIRANIVQTYAELARRWAPGLRIGLFGFSRGAYTMRSLGGALATCGVAAVPKGDDRTAIEERHAIAKRAVDIYALDPKKHPDERAAKADAFRKEFKCADVVPDVIGVFDTVRALGLPGLIDAFNLFNNHIFHDSFLNPRVRFGFQALSIDENRKIFKAEPWDESRETGARVLEQVWFPGVHSDVGGGYEDDRKLADASLNWMVQRLKAGPGIDLGAPEGGNEGLLLGTAHDERAGLGKLFYFEGLRTQALQPFWPRAMSLIKAIEHRFEITQPPYRPEAASGHVRVKKYYG